MKKRYVILFVLVVLLNVVSVSFASNVDVNAKSAILMEQSTKRVLYQKNAHIKLPMASTTKIMTALVVIENSNLKDVVTIPKEASGVEGSSIWLGEGEKQTVEDLLYGLMLSSGNDAAVALSTFVGGNVDNFIKMMNNRAKEIGAVDTNFVTPHGLHDDNHYTTAYDLALISAVAMDNEVFRTIVSTKSKTIPWESADWDRSLRNKNKIISQYDGGNGIKTGYTSNAGKCLVSAALRDEMQLIGVVLNCPDMFNESMKMLDFGFDNYKMTLLYDKEQSFGKCNIENGSVKSVDFYADKSIIFPIRENEKVQVKTNLQDTITAPVKKGDVVGNVEIFLDDALIAKSNLTCAYDVAKNTLGYNLKRIIKYWIKD